jgi:hypothetical protein
VTESQSEAPALNLWELETTGPAALAQVRKEELRSGRNLGDLDCSLDASTFRVVPRGDLVRNCLVDEKAVLDVMVQHVALAACWHLQGLAQGGMASCPPGMVRSGGIRG